MFSFARDQGPVKNSKSFLQGLELSRSLNKSTQGKTVFPKMQHTYTLWHCSFPKEVSRATPAPSPLAEAATHLKTDALPRGAERPHCLALTWFDWKSKSKLEFLFEEKHRVLLQRTTAEILYRIVHFFFFFSFLPPGAALAFFLLPLPDVDTCFFSLINRIRSKKTWNTKNQSWITRTCINIGLFWIYCVLDNSVQNVSVVQFRRSPQRARICLGVQK